MTKVPTNKISATLKKMDTSDVAMLANAARLDTASEEFGELFKENPAAALATKGISISPAEARNITDKLSGIGGGGGLGAKAETEVSVSVKVKF